MDTTDQKSVGVRRNRRHTDAFKLGLIEQAGQPGASVARVARDAGVNANQVFAWIKQHRDGTLVGEPEAGAALLAVRVAEPGSPVTAAQSMVTVPGQYAHVEPPAAVMLTGTVALRVGRAELKIEGAPDKETLDMVLRCLMR